MNKKRILIIGIRKEHANILKEMFKNKVELDFITDNRKQGKHVTNQEAYNKIFNMVRIFRIVGNLKFKIHWNGFI